MRVERFGTMRPNSPMTPGDPMSRLPPFKSIEAFVVTARAMSFTEAASKLNLTVSAVSRRIQALELELGVPLFQRTSRAIKFSDQAMLKPDEA